MLCQFADEMLVAWVFWVNGDARVTKLEYTLKLFFSGIKSNYQGFWASSSNGYLLI